MEDYQEEQPYWKTSPPALLQYTLEQYVQAPGLVKQTNEWQHNIYQYVAEKDRYLQQAQQEISHLEKECSKLSRAEELLQERTQELIEKDKQLQRTEQELNHLKEGSLRASIVQHLLSLLTAISFGV